MKATSRIIILTLILAIVVSLSSCGGGGSGTLIRGLLMHNYGSSVKMADIVVDISGTKVTAGSDGKFFYSTTPGNYDITAAYADTGKGIAINNITHLTLADKEQKEVTIFLSDTGTRDAWTSYRQGNYTAAETAFQGELNGPSGDDASNGLGWTIWKSDRDYALAKGHLNNAISEVRNVEARAALAGIELARVNNEGGVAFDRALANLNAAIGEPGNMDTHIKHDNVREGDLLALKALLSFVSGDVATAQYILNNNADLLANQTNAGGQAALDTLDHLMHPTN